MVVIEDENGGLARTVTLKIERNQVVALREQLKEMGHRYCHSCYVCYDDWAFARRKCFDRQLTELNIKLLVAVSDLVSLDSTPARTHTKSATTKENKTNEE